MIRINFKNNNYTNYLHIDEHKQRRKTHLKQKQDLNLKNYSQQ